MKQNIVKMSLLATMFLSSGTYAATIPGSDAGSAHVPLTQYGFGGLNFDNIDVRMVLLDDLTTVIGNFNTANGTYTSMEDGDAFISDVYTGGQLRGQLYDKPWPIGEPAGIKVINGDTANNGKPENCIMAASYQPEVIDAGGNLLQEENFLNSDTPAPVICSSAPSSNKRFKLNMLPSTVANLDAEGYGQPVDLTFKVEAGANSRYQVMQKINNYTGVRLDGYKIEVLDDNNQTDPNLTLSIGIGELRDNDGKLTGGDIWLWDERAHFSPSLWGPQDFQKTFTSDGFFDDKTSGFQVSISTDKYTITGGPAILDGNYNALFGMWVPSKWQPVAMFYDEDNNWETESSLIAYWGTVPNAPTGTAPSWHKGRDYDLSDGDQSWAEPTPEELLAWHTDPRYEEGHLDDAINVMLNYIVEVGAISNKFTLRVTPHVASDQSLPSYMMDEDNYILPPTSYALSRGVVTLSPEPTFIPGTVLSVGVADADLNVDVTIKETVTITVKADTGDSEEVVLTETDVNSAVFSGILSTENSASAPTTNNGVMSVINDSVVTATYVDTQYGDIGITETLTASTTAKTTVIDDGDTDDVVDSDGNPASSGGGCTYVQNSKSFDMMFLFIVALGLLFPFRRRFIK